MKQQRRWSTLRFSEVEQTFLERIQAAWTPKKNKTYDIIYRCIFYAHSIAKTAALHLLLFGRRESWKLSSSRWHLFSGIWLFFTICLKRFLHSHLIKKKKSCLSKCKLLLKIPSVSLASRHTHNFFLFNSATLDYQIKQAIHKIEWREIF